MTQTTKPSSASYALILLSVDTSRTFTPERVQDFATLDDALYAYSNVEDRYPYHWWAIAENFDGGTFWDSIWPFANERGIELPTRESVLAANN